MSCRFKKVNPEKYGSQPRTEYDIKMLEAYNPIRTNYQNFGNFNNYGENINQFHAAPWPEMRTTFDNDIQKKWCPKCGSNVVEGYYQNDAYPWLASRTQFDIDMQQKFCPKCGPLPTPPGPTPPGPPPPGPPNPYMR